LDWLVGPRSGSLVDNLGNGLPAQSRRSCTSSLLAGSQRWVNQKLVKFAVSEFNRLSVPVDSVRGAQSSGETREQGAEADPENGHGDQDFEQGYPGFAAPVRCLMVASALHQGLHS
jgi:hypothetical protein